MIIPDIQLCDTGKQTTKLKLVCPMDGKEKVLEVNFPFMLVRIAFNRYYCQEKRIQDAFHFLPPDEREFLMTGLLPEEQDY